MQRTILFEHIPKTGGITLRGILHKKYAGTNIFFINSHDPRISYDEFTELDQRSREKYRVIAGHGASIYRQFLEDAFTVTILRQPISLFFSQYNYLRVTDKNRYWKDVSKMNSAEEYLEYAIRMGQDNLMTRFLANSMQWTMDNNTPDQMDKSGKELLERAKSNLREFDAVISLNRFDAGVFAMSRKLGWKSIPLYKPSNRNTKKPSHNTNDRAFMAKLHNALRFDLELYDYFLSNKLDISLAVDFNNPGFRFFRFRQQIAKRAAIALGKN